MTQLEGLNDDFRDVLLALARENVDFLIVGAYALAFHGAPRMTGDIDIVIRPTKENAAHVWRALASFGAPLAAAGVAESDFAEPGVVYQIGQPPRRIDVMTEISGLSFDEAWSSRIPATLGDVTVCFIGRDALIRNKRSAGRPKDLADVARFAK